MKIAIIGGGNMGGAIALGLIKSNTINVGNLTIIERKGANTSHLASIIPNIKIVENDYTPLTNADLIIIAVKPWIVKDIFIQHGKLMDKPNQMIASIAGGITLSEMQEWVGKDKTLMRIMPNTAIAVQQSMTFISSINATDMQVEKVANLFMPLGKVEIIDEKFISAATSLTSCGIAFAFRYIRAAMEGGVEMGFYPNQSKELVLQTLRGAIDLLEANGTHPEAEIDKVTTAGGITIKGLNEMEHAGFTSSVIKGLKASKV